MTVVIHHTSIEQLICTVVANVDPTTYVVEFAFTQYEDDPMTWTAGSWLGSAVQSGTRYRASALTPLIGSGALDLASGEWLVWLRPVATPEVPPILIGKLVVAE